jgi:hypothetical protein
MYEAWDGWWTRKTITLSDDAAFGVHGQLNDIAALIDSHALALTGARSSVESSQDSEVKVVIDALPKLCGHVASSWTRDSRGDG